MAAPLVGILMGSTSDADRMRGASDVLKDLGIEHEVRVMSAHRTPDVAGEYAASARERGLKAIICGAGAAAHLAGAIAARTTLPVIGVPIASSALQGVDALYATVQMPSGIPVATVGVDTSKNAGILAAQIIGVDDPEIAAKLDAMRAANAEKVLASTVEYD